MAAASSTQGATKANTNLTEASDAGLSTATGTPALSGLSTPSATTSSVASDTERSQSPDTKLLTPEPAATSATYGAADFSKLTPRPSPRAPLESISPYMAEFLGTFVLVFTVGCCILSPGSQLWSPTAIASVFMVMVYATGPVSGGHLNPAVSFCLGLTGAIPWRTVVKYWVVQLVAGLVAGSCFCSLFSPRSASVGPVAPFPWGLAMLAEVLYTFMLCFVVSNCAVSKRNNPGADGNQFYALAISFVYVAGGYAVGGVSGACFNPAVSLGLSITGSGLKWGLAWTAAELAGALLAAVAFRLMRSEEYLLPVAGLARYKPKLRARCASEFLGTFMLVLTVGLNVTSSSPAKAFSVAAALVCMIYSLGNVSGGHFNPAVTLGVVSSGRGFCTPRDGAFYAASQLLGGVTAGLLYAAFHAAGPTRKVTFGLAPGKGFGRPAAGTAELLFTSVLTYAVLTCATTKVPSSWITKQNFYFALAIGSAVAAGGMAVGAISGAELNPAVSLGMTMANAVHHGTAPPPSAVNFFLFSAFELAGGLIGTVAFRLTHAAEYRPETLNS